MLVRSFLASFAKGQEVFEELAKPECFSLTVYATSVSCAGYESSPLRSFDDVSDGAG